MRRRGAAPRACWLSVLVAFAAIGGCLSGGDGPRAEPGDGVGPDWSFTGTDGRTYTRDEPARNATLLFFMATWCSSCKSLAPMVAEVNATYAPLGLRTFSLSIDPSDAGSLDSYAWKEERGQDWPHAVDEGQRMMRAFGITQQSSLVVLDAEGHVVQSWGYGRARGDEVRAAVETALARVSP